MNFMEELTSSVRDHGGIIDAKTVAEHGISTEMLYKLYKNEKFHRIIKGQYILSDVMLPWGRVLCCYHPIRMTALLSFCA